MPTTTKSYVLGLARSFDSEWKYELRLFEGSIFNCREGGLITAATNHIKNLQSVDLHIKSHNVF